MRWVQFMPALEVTRWTDEAQLRTDEVKCSSRPPSLVVTG